MPWCETTPMRERLEFLRDHQRGLSSFAALCRHYEISRKTGYKWLTRLGEEGLSFALPLEGETHATLVLLDVAQGDRYFNHRVNHQ